MSTELKHRRGTSAQHATFTGAEGEITFNTTTKTLHAHDGVTPGGIPQGAGTTAADLAAHEANTANPHSVTKAQVGLSNVDNVSASALRDRSTHTGSQLAATISDFASTVRDTLLTGFSTAANAAVTAVDSVLVAVGKLQAQINTVLDRTLTGLSTATATVVVATDSILVGIGKLQAQVTARALLTSNTFTGAQVFSDQQVSRAMLLDTAVVVVDKGNSGTSAQTLDYSAGGHQRLVVTGAFTLSTSNWPPSGNLGELSLELVNGAAFAVTWPTINWVRSDGSVTTTFSANGVTLQTSGIDWVFLWSRDGGATIYGKILR